MGMIKRVFWIIVIVTLAVGALILLGRFAGSGRVAAPQTNTASAAFAADMSAFDFGTISMAAGNVTHDFIITNTSDAPVTITEMYTSCMCTSAELTVGEKRFGPYGMPGHASTQAVGATLQPGESATVMAMFDPAAHGPAGVGQVVREIYLETSAGQAPFVLSFRANVTP